MLSDKKLEIKVDTSGNLKKAKTFVFDKSKNTLTAPTKNGSLGKFRYAAYLPDGGNLFYDNN